jgi:hypothetical protein
MSVGQRWGRFCAKRVYRDRDCECHGGRQVCAVRTTRAEDALGLRFAIGA